MLLIFAVFLFSKVLRKKAHTCIKYESQALYKQINVFLANWSGMSVPLVNYSSMLTLLRIDKRLKAHTSIKRHGSKFGKPARISPSSIKTAQTEGSKQTKTACRKCVLRVLIKFYINYSVAAVNSREI